MVVTNALEIVPPHGPQTKNQPLPIASTVPMSCKISSLPCKPGNVLADSDTMLRVVDWQDTPWALGNDHVPCEMPSNLPNECSTISTGSLMTHESATTVYMSQPGTSKSMLQARRILQARRSRMVTIQRHKLTPCESGVLQFLVLFCRHGHGARIFSVFVSFVSHTLDPVRQRGIRLKAPRNTTITVFFLQCFA